MEIPSKQKYKKKRTRRNLDEIRKRSRCELKDKVKSKKENILQMKVSSYIKINPQITSERLTLALLNNSVRSETVTRIPLSRIVHKSNKHEHNGKENENINSTCSKLSHQLNNTGNYNILPYGNKEITYRKSNDQVEVPKNLIINVSNNTPTDTLAKPLNFAPDPNFLYKDSEDFEGKQVIVVNSTSPSCSSSDMETGACIYEKFMNDLPNYVKDHFPMLAKEGVMRKNIAQLKQAYQESNHPKVVSDDVQCINSKVINSSIHSEYSITQNSMDYMHTGSSWQQNVKNNYSPSVASHSSSSLSHFASDSSNIFNQDSPEYIYFPHKLNH